MKKIFCLVAIVVLVALSIVSAFAHSGGTDSNGGHYNRDTGTYHYHHGYSAHQHPNGVCPYKDDETTTKKAKNYYNSNHSSQISSAKKTAQKDFGWFQKLDHSFKWGPHDIIHLLLSLIFFVIVGYWLFSSGFYPKFTIDDFRMVLMYVFNLIPMLTFSLSVSFEDLGIVCYPISFAFIMVLYIIAYGLSTYLCFLIKLVVRAIKG